MGERPEGCAEGVDEGLARGIGYHIGRCEETRGGSNDALHAYNSQFLRSNYTMRKCLRSCLHGAFSSFRTSPKP
jgi:hypothetical protein